MFLNITFDFSYWSELASLNNPFLIAWQLIKDGWLIFVFLFIYLLWLIWVEWRQQRYKSRWTFNLLAVDIPRDNEQSPKAVEYIFSQLAGAYNGRGWIEKFWYGEEQEDFSFEIVSDGGYLQFYIYTNSQFRDLVEATIYAQYPDAIITEVEDYTAEWKKLRFPNDKYEMWSTEMKFTKDNAYPIRTYPMFEHTLSQELKDPMAGLLEILSRIRPGEKIWLQLVITPIDQSWIKAGERLVKKITGQGAGGGSILDKILDFPIKFLGFITDAIFPGSEEAEKKTEEPFSVQRLTPGEVDALKAIQDKISKIGFQAVFRMIYLSPKELYETRRGVNGVLGAINQFGTLNLNAIVPNKKSTTSIHYFFIKTRLAWRKNKLLRRYINRTNEGSKMILNIEELASLYHFPVSTVKAPMLAKTESRRAEPPVGLPAEILAPAAPGAGEAPEEAEEERDEFVELLEDVAERKIAPDSSEEAVPSELTGSSSPLEDTIQQVLKENRGTSQQKIESRQKAASKSKGGVPDNLPIKN
jgi:hypothetical protein